MELNPQVAPLPPRRPVLQDVPLQFHLPKKDAKSKCGREKKTWNGEWRTPGTELTNQWDQNDIMTSCWSWLHGGCEHSSTLPGKRHSAVVFFGLLLLLLSQALVPISPHHRRKKSCCSCCCQGTEITAVNVLPGTMCAAASSMRSSLGTDRHKLIQFSNWCHRSYWWHGILTQLYTQQQSRQQKTSSCRVFSFKLARVFLQISGQSTRHTGNVKTSQWCEEAYHQYPTRLLPT